ncbi:MAG: hypothetical protein WCT49_04655 [Candidatus Paceibacterota bacterium]|nr:hypothetical protein [Candidatus Paceibacterota bacterium]
MNKIYILILIVLLFSVLLFGGSVALYTFDRNAKLDHNEECGRLSAESRAQGKEFPPCAMEIIPPTFTDRAAGKQLTELTERLRKRGCDQSATTTDCSKISTSVSSTSPVYIPPNAVKPMEEWTTATDTPITLAGFSFTLPPGWHGSVYEKPYMGGTHTLVKKDTEQAGFTIDCPPDGKGMEETTRLSSEERQFFDGENSYTVSFEKWISQQNDSWLFVLIQQATQERSLTKVCVVSGSTEPDIASAVKAIYDTLAVSK